MDCYSGLGDNRNNARTILWLDNKENTQKKLPGIVPGRKYFHFFQLTI